MMNAAVLTAPDHMGLCKIPTPDVGSGELVLRVKAAAVCGTDCRIFRGKKTKGVRFPSVLGHEFAGEIVDIGNDAEGFSLGEAVSVDPVVPCLRCAYCQNGMENVCANRRAIGYEFDGAFAEYVRIPAIAIDSGNVFKIPKGLAWEHAALAEPLACCLNGQENAQIGLGDVVVILGAGPIGMMHFQLAKIAGARHVLVSEPNERRREIAREMDTDTVVNPLNTDLKQAILEVTDGLGADVVLVAVSISEMANEALTLVRKGGHVNLFAGFSVGDAPAIDVNLIHYNELVVTGASALARRHYAKALRLIQSGTVNVASLVTHRFPLKDISEALATSESGQGLKIVLKP